VGGSLGIRAGVTYLRTASWRGCRNFFDGIRSFFTRKFLIAGNN
jgi:hypothetical protein